MRWAVGALAVVSIAWAGTLGCGGAPASGEKGATATPSSGAASAEDACLAIADATHEKKGAETEAIKVSHILVEHRDAKNAKSGVTRSRGEACLRAREAQKKLVGGADFAKLVSEYSDSPGVSGDGAMGEVRRPDLDPKFADAAFQLDRGQMSDVVETPFGFHVIVRTE